MKVKNGTYSGSTTRETIVIVIGGIVEPIPPHGISSSGYAQVTMAPHLQKRKK